MPINERLTVALFDSAVQALARALVDSGMLDNWQMEFIKLEVIRGSYSGGRSYGLWYRDRYGVQVSINSRHGIDLHGVYAQREAYIRIRQATDTLNAVIRKEATSGR